MRVKLWKAIVLSILCVIMLPLAAWAGELDDFVNNLSLEARADSSGFKYRLHSEFEVAGAKVDMVVSNVDDPADAYMILRLASVTGRTPEAVLDVYKANRTRGWGVIAKELGIKPGSPEFHALKAGGSSGKKAKKGKGHK